MISPSQEPLRPPPVPMSTQVDRDVGLPEMQTAATIREAPSAQTPRTAAATSRARELGAALRRYAAALTSLLGAAGLTLGSVLSGIGIKDWLERWGFWPTFALAVLGVLLAILTQMRQGQQESIAALERRADQQVTLLEQQGERREQHHQEMLELIMDTHARALGELRGEVGELRREVRERMPVPPTKTLRWPEGTSG